jgi:hypothetical protein
MMKPKFEMWDILKDIVSGREGVVMGITFYATDCVHYGLAPQKTKDTGEMLEWAWFDETRLQKKGHLDPAAKVKPQSGPDMNPRQY